MADVFTKEKRSEVMSKIRSSNTKPEMIVRRYLHKEGFRYSLHSTKLPGKPDIVLASRKIVVLVNGCFWHGHKKCSTYKTPKSNREFWVNKISTNIIRDKRNLKTLTSLGYKVFVVWECQLKMHCQQNTLSMLAHKIKASSS